MTVRITRQGCKVETTCVIQPNGQYREEITLSVGADEALALAIDEPPAPALPRRVSARVRSTKYGFELVERRP